MDSFGRNLYDCRNARFFEQCRLVYRGTHWESLMLENLGVGDTFTDPAFLSASKMVSIAEKFRRNVRLQILGQSGRVIDAYAASPDPESEVLFFPNIQFKVLKKTSITPDPNSPFSYTLFELEEISGVTPL
ncbi:MAG: ADP-ribosyltransferase domain-containing protein [Bdellovibrionota bacterium]